MHVLVLDNNRTNGLAQALRLSSYGLIAETVPDVEEASRRLSTMAFDVVLCTVPAWDNIQSAGIQTLREIYPNTEFHTNEEVDNFLKRVR
jgi:CheY-like chemotaxis protein